MNYFDNGNPKQSRITSIDILNSHDISLLLTASGKSFASSFSLSDMFLPLIIPQLLSVMILKTLLVKVLAHTGTRPGA